MSFSKTIKLVRKEKIVGEIELNCSISGNLVSIIYADNLLIKKGEKVGPSYFYLLAEIREEYEEQGVFLLCKGAQLSVFTGGLTSDSSLGLLAYEILDNNFQEHNVVNIFDDIDVSEVCLIASFDEQKDNRRKILRKQRSRQR